jgi:hypothetical protein
MLTIASLLTLLVLGSSMADWSPDMGNYSMSITSTPKAQELFDEGIRLEFGFDQTEARLCFNRSIAADPDCAMCWWGLAWSLGPFLNHPMVESLSQLTSAVQAANTAAAMGDKKKLTTKEQLLIKAMGLRYPASIAGNQTETYIAYAAAMQEAHAQLPSDADIAALAAESLLVLQCDDSGYNFYGPDGKPLERVQIADALLQPHIQPHSPLLHPYAQHLFIHLTEPSTPGFAGKYNAGRAAKIADALEEEFKFTDSQHLQHMAGHTYLRIGRYNDAIKANIVAHNADERFLKNGHTPYGPGHNGAFLVYAAAMDGQSKVFMRMTMFPR